MNNFFLQCDPTGASKFLRGAGRKLRSLTIFEAKPFLWQDVCGTFRTEKLDYRGNLAKNLDAIEGCAASSKSGVDFDIDRGQFHKRFKACIFLLVRKPK